MVSLSNVFAILVLAGLSAALAWFALLLLVGLVVAGLAVLLVRPILAALLLPRIALVAIFHVVFPVSWTALCSSGANCIFEVAPIRELPARQMLRYNLGFSRAFVSGNTFYGGGKWNWNRCVSCTLRN